MDQNRKEYERIAAEVQKMTPGSKEYLKAMEAKRAAFIKWKDGEVEEPPKRTSGALRSPRFKSVGSVTTASATIEPVASITPERETNERPTESSSG